MGNYWIERYAQAPKLSLAYISLACRHMQEADILRKIGLDLAESAALENEDALNQKESWGRAGTSTICISDAFTARERS